MFAVNRACQQALRRVARPAMIQQNAAPLAVSAQVQQRNLTTQKITPADSYNILVEQRKKRPTSPHLTIYRPQVTWIGSSLNRITGVALSGGFYVFGLSYLFAPLIGSGFSSASLVASVAAWPVAAKIAAKAAVAFPFAFHSWNGLRHLAWDTGRTFQNKTIIKTGWAVFALSGLSTVYLAAFL